MISALRASSLPMAFRCAASVRRGAIPLNESNAASSAGTAAHEALRALAETGSVNWDAIPAVASRHNADPDEVRMLAAMGAKLWPSVVGSFPDALTEVELAVQVADGVTLTGHIDLLSVTDTVARAGDWKTGRKHGDYSHQMRAYGALVLLNSLELTEVTVTVLWLRDQEIENYTMTRADAEAWLEELRATVINWDGVYRPGPHCAHCPRSHECDAANALVRRDVSVIADKAIVYRAEAELDSMTADEKVDLFEKATLVVKYAERVRDAIKKHVVSRGDIVAHGVRLTLDVEERRELDPQTAWPVLEEAGFNDAEFAQCIDIRVSKAEQVVAKRAGKGFGAGAVRALREKLEASGAVHVKEITKLVQKRA